MIFKRFLVSFILLCTLMFNALAQADWVHFDANNKLEYKTDAKGNRVMDFSQAGYMGGGVSIPDVAVKVTVSPGSGDQTSAIQNAINQVSAMPLVNGFRGAVLLEAGTYNVSSTIRISASGVVLRGSGSGTDGTIVNMTGATGYLCFSLSGSGSYSTSNTVNITDSYVPSGTNSFNVSDASGFRVGDAVLVYRPVTAAWVSYLKMDLLVRDGLPQTWISTNTKISTDRVIKSISGNTITLDAPLTDSFDAAYLGTPVGTFAKYTFSGRISQVGIENLRIQAPPGTVVYSAVTMDNIINSWMRNIVGQETQNAFNVNKNGKHLTLENIVNNLSVVQTISAATADFSITGTGILLNKCQMNGTGTWPVVTQATGTGPIVILNFTSTETAGISPHARWTTGVLSDNCKFPNATSGKQGISYKNRDTAGSGHGWTTGWSVAWNVETPYFIVSAAPGTYNWAIGGHGTKTSRVAQGDADGIYDHFNSTVTPSSLYLQQLYERLGAQAVANIGYPFIELPIAPSNLTATHVSDKQIDLAWTDHSDSETAFKLERSVNQTTWDSIASINPNITTYSDVDLDASLTYYYRICAVNAGGKSPYSNILSVTTSDSDTPPALPSGLIGVPQTTSAEGRLYLMWTDNSKNETIFRIERSSDGSTGWTSVGTVPMNVNSFTDTGLEVHATYYYRLRAENKAGNSSYTEPLSVTIPVAAINIALNKPVTVSNVYRNNANYNGAKAVDGNRTGTRWATDFIPTAMLEVNLGGTYAFSQTITTDYKKIVSGYKIQYWNGYEWVDAYTGDTLGVASKSDYFNSVIGSKVRLNILSINSSTGGASIWEFEVYGSATTVEAPAPPSNLTATAISEEEIALAWSDNSESETFYIVESSTNGTDWVAADTVDANTMYYTADALSPETPYYYRIRGGNLGGVSDYSNTATATTLVNSVGNVKGSGLELWHWEHPTTISFNLPTASKTKLVIYDMQGRIVCILWDGPAHSGINTIIWDTANVPDGMYLARITTEEGMKTIKLGISKR